MLLTLEFTLINIFLAVVISIALNMFAQKFIYTDENGHIKLPNPWSLVHFMTHMIYEIYIASFIHIIRIIKMDHNPVLIKLKLDVENPLIITLIANSITMTPGTITVDADGNELTVLTIRDDPEDIEKLKKTVKEKLEDAFVSKQDVI